MVFSINNWLAFPETEAPLSPLCTCNSAEIEAPVPIPILPKESNLTLSLPAVFIVIVLLAGWPKPVSRSDPKVSLRLLFIVEFKLKTESLTNCKVPSVIESWDCPFTSNNCSPVELFISILLFSVLGSATNLLW